jgi:thiamine kinase-like enzyme
MKNNDIEAICAHFDLGLVIKPPIKVEGGLLHYMWRLDTQKGAYGVKQLSKDIDLTNQNIIKNYELSENIASQFISQSIPGVCAIQKSGKYLLVIENTGFLVYPWVRAKALDQHAVSENHALKIAIILAKMHHINLNIEALGEVEFDVHDNAKITQLADLALKQNLVFSLDLTENLPIILEINRHYHQAILILKNLTVVSHGDLDQKNVLWDKENNPILIDWESARKLNPTYEILGAALDWSGMITKLDQGLFMRMINSYKEAGGIIDINTLEAAFYGVLGNWINWLVYNIKRAKNQKYPEQQKIGCDQVEQTMATILRLNKVVPDVIKIFESKL